MRFEGSRDLQNCGKLRRCAGSEGLVKAFPVDAGFLGNGAYAFGPGNVANGGHDEFAVARRHDFREISGHDFFIFKKFGQIELR